MKKITPETERETSKYLIAKALKDKPMYDTNIIPPRLTEQGMEIVSFLEDIANDARFDEGVRSYAGSFLDDIDYATSRDSDFI